ncbi:ParM/StbA family protein [Fodinibius halophilus]|uniref:ParM/StbA family protein n=1 Tax=Fodinibius halophilus TaxID=1736908 RepID=A0A6M1TCH4_9BACT|nr:ParM/StbA family protein [Fodinibius halophilus]NGP90063.1 ParM/StbA family protein [Fodinibius halophilus]
MKISVFPSVYESTRSDLNGVSNDLLNGLKIDYNDESYMIGNLALQEGLSPHRLMNCAPGELDFDILFRAALLLAQKKAGSNFSVTVGFPFEMYQKYNDTAKQRLTKSFDVLYDSSTFENGLNSGTQSATMQLQNVDVIPEIAGSIISLRYGKQQEKDDFFVISLGYGSMEAVVSRSSGIIRRTATSTHGLRYAVNMMKEELQKEHYLGFKTEHQLNVAFKNGEININKRMVDLTALRRRVLKSYFENIIRPALANAFQDSDFATSSKLYLVGGGAYFKELTDRISKEYDGILNIKIPDKPEQMAVKGYCLNTAMQFEGEGIPVGIDMGNANTLVAIMDEEE